MKALLLMLLVFISSEGFSSPDGEWTITCAKGECPAVMLTFKEGNALVYTDKPNFKAILAQNRITIPNNIDVTVVSTERFLSFKNEATNKVALDDVPTPWDGKVVWACVWKGTACYAGVTITDSMLTWVLMAGVCTEAYESCDILYKRWKAAENAKKTGTPASSGSGGGSSGGGGLPGGPLHPGPDLPEGSVIVGPETGGTSPSSTSHK